mmetsp:Transcript_34845/g.87789  ORF Transcript_34845/g.87789 Transcript_34845/m.87789 type:complete len:225 (+) Transcript_34845:172-846(+)
MGLLHPLAHGVHCRQALLPRYLRLRGWVQRPYLRHADRQRGRGVRRRGHAAHWKLLRERQGVGRRDVLPGLGGGGCQRPLLRQRAPGRLRRVRRLRRRGGCAWQLLPWRARRRNDLLRGGGRGGRLRGVRWLGRQLPRRDWSQPGSSQYVRHAGDAGAAPRAGPGGRTGWDGRGRFRPPAGGCQPPGALGPRRREGDGNGGRQRRHSAGDDDCIDAPGRRPAHR